MISKYLGHFIYFLYLYLYITTFSKKLLLNTSMK